MLLSARSVGRVFGTGDTAVCALRDISFSIAESEFVAIMGRSGSGKSTLMNLIALLDRPSSGTLRLAGCDVTSMSDNTLSAMRNREIGIVFQSYNLLARSTAAQNVALPLVYSGMSGRLRQSLAHEALEMVGLHDKASKMPNQLSGGEQQRVAIARALVNNPRLILADEPTGALDSKTGQEVLDLLARLHRKGCTILMITHDAGIAAHASRRLSLRDGELVDDTIVQERDAPAFVKDLQEHVA